MLLPENNFAAIAQVTILYNEFESIILKSLPKILGANALIAYVLLYFHICIYIYIVCENPHYYQ